MAKRSEATEAVETAHDDPHQPGNQKRRSIDVRLRCSGQPTLISNLSDETGPIVGGIEVRRQMIQSVGEPAHGLDLDLRVERAQPHNFAFVVFVPPPFAVVGGFPADRSLQVIQLLQQFIVRQTDVVGAGLRTIHVAFAAKSTGFEEESASNDWRVLTMYCSYPPREDRME